MHWEIFGSYTYQLVSRLKRVRSFPGSWGLAFPCELERKKSNFLCGPAVWPFISDVARRLMTSGTGGTIPDLLRANHSSDR